MPFLLLSGFLLFAAYPLIGTTMAVWVLAASQLALLVGEIRKKQVSGVGGFIFMSFLFFGVRPIYLINENNYELFQWLFRIRVDLAEVGDSMWWATAGLVCFGVGAFLAPRAGRNWVQRRRAKSRSQVSQQLVGPSVCYGLLFFQFLTLPVMYVLARSGRSLYASGLGAYAYDLPVPLQSVHIITLVVLLERYLRTKSTQSLVLLCLSGFAFLDFTWLMRDVSMFRGFYIAGVMIAGIAGLQRLKGRVGYAWLIIPILGLQPFFQYLGQDRLKNNVQLAEAGIVHEVLGKQTIGEAYWNFFEAKGDMNIFDTFVAAKKAEPAYYPYIWSWIYAPLHFIPRKLWSGKPEKGITQDVRFMRGAPYCPGIAGFFLLDGGLVWMLGSMAVLGFLVSMLDVYIFTMPRGYLQYCLIGIVTVNAMFLSRAFLWFYFWQIMYAVVPCVLLAWLFSKKGGATRSRRPNRHRLGRQETLPQQG
jgi:hypothetical protein